MISKATNRRTHAQMILKITPRKLIYALFGGFNNTLWTQSKKLFLEFNVIKTLKLWESGYLCVGIDFYWRSTENKSSNGDYYYSSFKWSISAFRWYI